MAPVSPLQDHDAIETLSGQSASDSVDNDNLAILLMPESLFESYDPCDKDEYGVVAISDR